MACSVAMACDASSEGSGQLKKLMSHPDVKQSLASPAKIYGCDQRPIDKSIFTVTTSGGSFAVGNDCSPKGCSTTPNRKCVGAPAGVKALIDFLEKLDEKMAATKECSSAFASP
jgi:hypothetical protein